MGAVKVFVKEVAIPLGLAFPFGWYGFEWIFTIPSSAQIQSSWLFL